MACHIINVSHESECQIMLQCIHCGVQEFAPDLDCALGQARLMQQLECPASDSPCLVCGETYCEGCCLDVEV